ncbi:MAG TPA: FtsQ-type POTRA domain-containing protein [Candidatus Anaerobiospirillum stercoravium]|nr:FtsQ-type POTRA domain-containing protein [Candidatus Anaerobiospirillum stercoravium]
MQSRTKRRRSRGSFLLGLLVFVLCLGLSYLGFKFAVDFTQNEATFPVARVEVKGQLKYITQEEIATTVGKLVGGKNLTSLDLARLHNALVQMPWMAQVAVSKRFPDTIVVEVVEHSAAARWRSSGLYDQETDSVFYPDVKQLDLPLVLLSAPHDSLAGDLYHHAAQFINMCQATPYQIKEVHLDAVRGYRIRLEGDVWLILGRETSPNLPLIRLKRFLLAFPQTRLTLAEISYVDLRYDNGFAVGERQANYDGVTGTVRSPQPEAPSAADAAAESAADASADTASADAAPAP